VTAKHVSSYKDILVTVKNLAASIFFIHNFENVTLTTQMKTYMNSNFTTLPQRTKAIANQRHYNVMSRQKI